MIPKKPLYKKKEGIKLKAKITQPRGNYER
jgi:hypothetical protein